jgi:nitric oxide synthase oxygenase domain/subunit
MFKELCIHIKESSNNGVIMPMISVFRERRLGVEDQFRVWNGQLISYAGYQDTDDPEVVIGDKSTAAFTTVSAVIACGQRQETLDLPYLTLLCDNLKNRMFLQNFFS